MKTFLSLLLLALGSMTQAQTFTVVADSLRLPNGLEVDAQGRLWVVESGYGFDDGAVSIVQPDGSLLPVLAGLPSFFDTMTQENVGPWHTLLLPNNKVAVSMAAIGQVMTFDLNGFTPGVTPPMTAASSTSSLDVYGYAMGQGFLESDPYTMATDANGDLFIADAAANAVFKANSAGQLSVFATFPPFPNPFPFGPPMIDAVPTRIVDKPGGGFYVCQLTGFPFPDSAASVFSVDANGGITPYATGLTLLTDMKLDAGTGDLYVLQIGKFDLSIFNFAPNSAKVYRLHPGGSREVVAENFDVAPGMTLDGHGNLYVTELASGRILRMDGVATATQQPASDLSGFSLSPNPASDRVQIDFSLTEKTPVAVRILDASGRLVFSQNLGALEPGAHQTSWLAGTQHAGLYWVDIQTNAGTKTRKLVVR